MSIGVSTACFYPLETELALEEVGKMGIDTTEIFFNADCELKESFIDILEDIKEEYKINIVSVHPTMSLAESFVFFSNYERRFREGLNTYARYSEIAARLGAKYIIMHGGKPNGILSDEEYCERYFEINRETQKNGVTVLQENVVRFRACNKEFMQSMVDILGNDAHFCLDIKQSIRCGYSPLELIEEFSDNIRHYHISDHTVASDCMLPGNGGFDFKNFFDYTKSKGYKGSYITEVYKYAYKEYEEIAKSYNFLKNI